MRNKQTYHYLYRTTCRLTGKFYVGMHSTQNLDDGYLGSGKILRRSIKKYGADAHTIEILEWFDNREALVHREREVVDLALLSEELCMNIRTGGRGGFGEENAKTEHQRKANQASQIRQRELHKNEEWLAKKAAAISFAMKEAYAEGRRTFPLEGYWRGRKHTEETRRKIGAANSVKLVGKQNPNFGRVWMTSEHERKSKPFEKSEVGKMLESGWKIGRRIKW